ncbi:hypothetical protein OJF2_65740 [Aquisphaera giovannonii]|uniref:Uncharacterized protein n=1 Tax=Aquisphaera giovannonii TaxID=406548 RepID=A0A5B9WBC6_9BACT|nr:hypothetical protein OJF2_65740 [Aquisphaera giovannonii]
MRLSALAWGPSGMDAGRERAASALRRLRAAHRAQARPDLGRVHPSWLERALQDESPSVRRLVRDGGPARSEAAAWALALWTERLVGGEPPDPSEPAAILALAGLPPSGLYRLVVLAGIAKVALAGDPRGMLAGRPAWAARGDWFASRLGGALGEGEGRPRAWAARDIEASPRAAARTVAEAGPRRGLASLGLVTLARLLSACDPHRVRWALQHVPYPVAKRLRGLMAASPEVAAGVRDIETLILESARERSAQEQARPSAGPRHQGELHAD